MLLQLFQIFEVNVKCLFLILNSTIRCVKKRRRELSSINPASISLVNILQKGKGLLELWHRWVHKMENLGLRGHPVHVLVFLVAFSFISPTSLVLPSLLIVIQSTRTHTHTHRGLQYIGKHLSRHKPVEKFNVHPV